MFSFFFLSLSIADIKGVASATIKTELKTEIKLEAPSNAAAVNLPPPASTTLPATISMTAVPKTEDAYDSSATVRLGTFLKLFQKMLRTLLGKKCPFVFAHG